MSKGILNVRCVNKVDLGTGAFGHTRVFYIFKETNTEEMFIYWTTTNTKIGKSVELGDICKLETHIEESKNEEGLSTLIRPTLIEV